MVAVKQTFPHHPDGSIDLNTWLNQIKTYYKLNHIDLIEKTAYLAETHTKGLTTFYGQPYIEQSLEMAEIGLNLHLDQEAIAASLILSTIQHTGFSLDSVKEKLGEPIAKLITGVNQMNVINTLQTQIPKNRDDIQIDRLRKTFLAMVSDIRVVLIKLSEQLSIMRGIKHINPAERRRIAQETLDVYAPLANRLGIGQVKWELEDLAFHYTNPEIYKMIASFLAERRFDREERIKNIIISLQDSLLKSHIKASVTGRAKHIYSIFLKAQKKHVDYKDIYDCSAVRILVPNIDDCYKALSIANQLWEPIPEEFDDYIANPKPNGYRSIHTAVLGPDGKNLEIQIRTQTMHEEAEQGVAAHWIYKENKAQPSGYEAKITFLRQLLAWQKELASDNTKIDEKLNQVLDDRVYAFTPQGDIIDLALGATPLDFAYHIHSSIGHRCRGAKINGHIVPLTYSLKTGDRVEIITTPHGAPSRDWLNKEFGYIKTTRARAKITQWFKQQDIDQYIDIGKQILERDFARAGIVHADLQKIAARLNFKNADALLSTLGHGSLRAAQVVHAAQQNQQQETIDEAATPITLQSKKDFLQPAGFQIDGMDDLLTRIAKCCKPIPGDAIIGYITQGRGVSIHRLDCANLSTASPHHHAGRLIQVTWDTKHLGAYYVDIHIRAQRREHLLKEITAILANGKMDLVSMNTHLSKKNNLLFITMTIQIRDIPQLNQLIQHIHQLPGVDEVKRII